MVAAIGIRTGTKPPFCLKSSFNQVQHGWNNWDKIEITKKSKARQKNFQQIAATEPTPCLHYVVRMRFLLPSYKGIRSAARPINGRN